MNRMTTPTAPIRHLRRTDRRNLEPWGQPRFERREHPGALQVVVYLPGTDPAGVVIESRGSELRLKARRLRTVRPNWTSLQLERALPDYALRLRLGTRMNLAAMEADLADGILTLTIPKNSPTLT